MERTLGKIQKSKQGLVDFDLYFDGNMYCLGDELAVCRAGQFRAGNYLLRFVCIGGNYAYLYGVYVGKNTAELYQRYKGKIA